MGAGAEAAWQSGGGSSLEFQVAGLAPRDLAPDIWALPPGLRLQVLPGLSEDGQRAYRFAVATDSGWLHLWFHTPLANRAESFLVVMFQPAQENPPSPAPASTLSIGVAGPAAWSGGHAAALADHGGPARVRVGSLHASRAVQGRLQFRFRLARRALGLTHARVRFRLLAGDDDSQVHRDHFPATPGEPAATWALLHLPPPNGANGSSVTARELEILQSLANHGGAAEVAELLNLSRRTVERHLENVRLKLRRQTSLECVVAALREGWIE